MHVSTRSYLTAGLSLVAASAIITTPMKLQPLQQEPIHPLVRNQQVQLAALATPITVHNVADNSAAVHVLADVSRAFQSAKIANAASAVEAASASPTAARTKVAQPAAAAIPSQNNAAQTGAVTTQDPETADTPGSNASKSSTAGIPVVNGFDPSGVGNVLASAAQLAIDTVIGVPAGLREQTAFNLDTFFFEVATLNPSMVGNAFSDFFANERDSLQNLGGILGDDFQQLQNSFSHVFGVDSGATVVTAAKTAAKVGTTETSQASGAVDGTKIAKQHQGNDFGSSAKGDVTGKHSQAVSVKRAKANTQGLQDDTAPAKQSGIDTKDQSNSKATESASDRGSQAGKGDATSEAGTANESTTKHNVTNPSGSSETVTKPGNKPSGSASSQSTSKKAGHTGGQPGGKKAGGNKSHHPHGHKG